MFYLGWGDGRYRNFNPQVFRGWQNPDLFRCLHRRLSFARNARGSFPFLGQSCSGLQGLLCKRHHVLDGRSAGNGDLGEETSLVIIKLSFLHYLRWKYKNDINLCTGTTTLVFPVPAVDGTGSDVAGFEGTFCEDWIPFFKEFCRAFLRRSAACFFLGF